MEQFNKLTNYPVIIAQLNLSTIVTVLIGVISSRRFPALLLYPKADDIVEASSELDGIIVILGGFRWIHNERYLALNTFERLLMLHTSEHNCSVDMLMPEHCAHIFSQQHP